MRSNHHFLLFFTWFSLSCSLELSMWDVTDSIIAECCESRRQAGALSDI